MAQQQAARLTLQQRRAASAHEHVKQAAGKTKTAKEYGSLVRGLPAMIQIDGLAQTLAFLKAKGGKDDTKPHNQAYAHLSEWLGKPEQFGFGSQKLDLMDWLLKQDSALYRMVTTEALAYLGWMKRFVEAFDLGDASGDRA
jgi:CRISPR-associated protein Cmr5